MTEREGRFNHILWRALKAAVGIESSSRNGELVLSLQGERIGTLRATDSELRLIESSITNQVSEQIKKIYYDTEEVYAAYLRAAPINAGAGTAGWYNLFEYNDIILAAKLYDDAFEYVTWERETADSVVTGCYCSSFDTAKDSFATRSNLVDSRTHFSSQELLLIYDVIEKVQTVNELLAKPLTQAQMSALDEISERICEVAGAARDRVPAQPVLGQAIII